MSTVEVLCPLCSAPMLFVEVEAPTSKLCEKCLDSLAAEVAGCDPCPGGNHYREKGRECAVVGCASKHRELCASTAGGPCRCEPTKENTLRRDLACARLEQNRLRKQVAEVERQLGAALREADRLRHGVGVEGDFVCPEALRADKAERLLLGVAEVLPTLRREHPSECDAVEWNQRERKSAGLDPAMCTCGAAAHNATLDALAALLDAP